VTAVPPLSDNPSDLSDLRQFGVALTRDDRVVLNHASAVALVDRLFRQASFEAVGAGAQYNTDQTARDDARVRAFAQFVRLHRRHVRRLTIDDVEWAWDEKTDGVHRKTRANEVGMAAAVRALPLELRESLLIIVLAGFTHQKAAIALDLSLATLIARLTKAREQVAASTRSVEAAAPRAAPYLRVVK
jgi:NaMN:DMB phosphoribosyltransferase